MLSSTRAAATALLATAAVMALAVPAHADAGETTTQVSNFAALSAQTYGHVIAKCPSTEPYAFSTEVSSGHPNPADSVFQKYDDIYTTLDGQSVRVNFHNSQTYAEAAKHPVIVTVRLTVNCSSVDHGRPTVHPFTERSMIPPSGDATITATCPPNFPKVLDVVELHSNGAAIIRRTTSGSSASITYHNSEEAVPGSGAVTAICGT
ncbi:hypothetical protein ABT294_03090 [Nonomuraea sp. NPDC000554]|uniref:hypothetical protein n=1 Tax=Nonomuraea sp. NPDC000554 TaxID=3154259 RepID=UPI0033313533